MKDVWHLFCSQISALRWWLLVWLAALTAWVVARWTYLTKFRDSWMRQEDYYWYGLLILSALLVASVLHLHPPAKRVAGWRVWPLRGWKVPTAQFIFVFVFLVLLPGAAEMVFLLHPRLDGFMASGIIQWLTRSLWPLPAALGLAACSHSLRRFILDALILTAIVIGVSALRTATYNWRLYMEMGRFRSLAELWVVRWSIPCFFGGALVVWAGICWQRIPKAVGRTFFFIAPLLFSGVQLVLRVNSHADPDYVPAVTGDAELAGRISIRLRPQPHHVSIASVSSLNALMQVDGLKPEESADVSLWKKKLRGEDITIYDSLHARESGSSFGDSDWNPWSGSSGSPEFREHTISTVAVPQKTLKLLKGKSCRFEATATVSVQRSTGVARLPFRMGATWEDTDREITIEFIGTESDAARRGIRGLSGGSEFVTSTVCRRFRRAAEHWLAIDLVHIPSGFRLHSYSGVNSGSELRRGRGFTYSATERVIRGFHKDTNWVWASGGLSTRALSHPEEFEFIARSSETVGSFAREVSADGFRVSSVPGGMAKIAIPDLTRPEAVESFFRELEDYGLEETSAGIEPVLLRCGPDVLPALVEFSLKNPASPLLHSVTNHARELNAALFKSERPDHRLAFFKGYGRLGLFMGADPSTPENNAALLKDGIEWVKEDPDNRLTASWLYQMRNKNVPALYPAIRRLIEKEGPRHPWMKDLDMPGLDLPAIVDSPPVSEPRGPSPLTESEFYRASARMTGPQESYREAVKQGKEWSPRVGAVIAASETPENTVHLWLKVWPEVSDCPSDPKAARAWIQAQADRLRFNPETRRYELR